MVSERLKVRGLNPRTESLCRLLSKVLNPDRFIPMHEKTSGNWVLEKQIKTALGKGYSETNRKLFSTFLVF